MKQNAITEPADFLFVFGPLKRLKRLMITYQLIRWIEITFLIIWIAPHHQWGLRPERNFSDDHQRLKSFPLQNKYRIESNLKKEFVILSLMKIKLSKIKPKWQLRKCICLYEFKTTIIIVAPRCS